MRFKKIIKTFFFTYHIPYSQYNGARPYMAAKAAARRVPPVPRRNHLFLRTLNFRLFHECRWKQLTTQGYYIRKTTGISSVVVATTAASSVCLERRFRKWETEKLGAVNLAHPGVT